MSPESAREVALDIIKMVDYDMWKECKAEPDEWGQIIDSIMYKVGDIFEEGYRYCEVDNGLEQL